MFTRSTLLLAALPMLAVSSTAMAEESETRTRGDVLVVEEIAPEEARAPRDSARIPVPTRGMDKDNVRNVFGEPAQEHSPVGDPPITRWDYAGYSVFFEYDKVLHSVITE
ncbi:MAG: hypothetical protein KY410_05690 [Proteobacteria bacterium]|nr:hypothetical protein [Pseudomonadota bacterium]